MSHGRTKVVVAMSGGVDSSVAAALLLRQGFEVVGVFMRLGTAHASGGSQSSEAARGCCSVLDAADAHRVAGTLGIPLYVLNFQDQFQQVIDYFVAEYNRGRTPNPCVRCNDWLKFGHLLRYADAAGAQFVATGHYARIGSDPATGQRALLRGRDPRKDQSYVLFGLPRSTLARVLLPVGDHEKAQVRDLARQLSLGVSEKPDSQEICFVPDGDYAALVRQRTPDRVCPGDLIDEGGAVIGRHPGHQHFTIGQRRGVRLAMGSPVYVTRIDADSNTVWMGPRQSLLTGGLAASGVNWLVDRAIPAEGLRCTAKVRYNHQPAAAVLGAAGESGFELRFDQAQSAITPGQAVVVYDGDIVLGGGWIERPL